jgi:hypothetical protein
LNLELVSIHFPKAAGSSLRGALARHFGDGLTLDYEHDPVNPDHLLSAPPALPDHTRAVHGHFRADRYAAYRRACHVTFLREPVANLISIYYFWRKFPPAGSPTHDRFLDERPTVLDFARFYWPVRRLMSVSYFGGFDVNSLDFVGFHETRARDLARLSKMLNIDLPAETYENRTPHDDERTALADDGRTLAALRSLLADDVCFYERARERWD